MKKSNEKDEVIAAFYRLILKRDREINRLNKLAGSSDNGIPEIKPGPSSTDEATFVQYKIQDCMGQTPDQIFARKLQTRVEKRQRVQKEWKDFKGLPFYKQIGRVIFFFAASANILGYIIAFALFILGALIMIFK